MSRGRSLRTVVTLGLDGLKESLGQALSALEVSTKVGAVNAAALV